MSDVAVQSAMDALWERSRDTVLNRVAAIERAAQSLLSAPLDEDARRNAEREAHKLAGVAGTFGFQHASVLAREAEQLLTGSGPIASRDVLRLSTIAAELRRQIDQDERPSAMSDDENTDELPIRSHLLILADDLDFRDHVALEARSLGVDVLAAQNVADARATLAAGPIDAVVLDLSVDSAGLPFLEELQVARPTLPVIVISSGDEFQDRVEAARLGGRGFLQKPVRPSQLIDLLRDSLVVAKQHVSTIVAVDDDEDLLALLEAMLQPLRARVIAVTDPLRALNALVEHAPDLVMLDEDMPGLSGIELCRVLRNDPRWAAVPVLFLTGQVDPMTVMRMFEAGADDFVAKPVLGPELVARVRNRLERTRMLRLAADVDSLTGVATRRRGIEVLERYFRLAQRQGQPISVAAIDLDHFKAVNDRWGHLVGDLVLRRVATILSKCFRGEDIVARWGGEEFVVGMYSMPGDAAARRLGQALEKLRGERFESAGQGFTVSFSAGVAEFPENGADWTTLYRVADDALARAKSEGRDRVVVA
ncbi:MAG TPA: diguanylate cyclase [Gemmatimonadaceae bacterium]|nr:diguanylate cyclase [Gemmatimonadaceae bacterium]